MIPASSPIKIGQAPRALVVRVAGRGMSFLLVLVLARILGLEGFGIYSYALAWVSVLLVVSSLGFHGVLLRQTAIAVSAGSPERIPILMRQARRTVLPLSVSLVIGASIVAVLVVDEVFLAPLLVILPSVVIRAASLVWEGVLQGLNHPDESFVSTYLVYPVVMLAAAGILVLLPVNVTPEMVAGLYVLAFGLGGLSLWGLSRRRLSENLEGATEYDGPAKIETSQLLPFTALTFVGVLSASVGMILLGAFDRPDGVGLLQIATRLTEPVLIISLVINVSLAPRIAGMFARGDLEGLRPIVGRNVQISFFFALPIAIAIFVFREPLLGLFGTDFEGASTTLAILIPAALFNVFTGGAGAALTMSRHVSIALLLRALGLVVNVALCLILIPLHGATGAAIAIAVDIVLVNATMALFAWRLIGLNTTALGTVRSFRR